MTRKEALQELLVKVKAGEWEPNDSMGLKNDAEMSFRGAVQDHCFTAWRAYNGSMDAALSLFKAVLPGWVWVRHDDGEILVFDKATHDWGSGIADTPSRALLIAILEALEVMEEG